MTMTCAFGHTPIATCYQNLPTSILSQGDPMFFNFAFQSFVEINFSNAGTSFCEQGIEKATVAVAFKIFMLVVPQKIQQSRSTNIDQHGPISLQWFVMVCHCPRTWTPHRLHIDSVKQLSNLLQSSGHIASASQLQLCLFILFSNMASKTHPK